MGLSSRDERVPRRAAAPAPTSPPRVGRRRANGRCGSDRRRPPPRRSRGRPHGHRRRSCQPPARLPRCSGPARRLPARLRGDRAGARHPRRHGALSHLSRPGRGSSRARWELRSPDRSSYGVAMSDHPLSRDELASALLDGEVAGPSAVDEALTARVEELRQAADAIGAPVAIDEDARERAIAAALAEFDAPATSVAPTSDVATPVVATAVAPTPLPQRRRVLPVLAGAAAAVVVLVGVVAVLQRDDSNPTEAASVVAPSEAVAGGLIAAAHDDGTLGCGRSRGLSIAAPPPMPTPPSRRLPRTRRRPRHETSARSRTTSSCAPRSESSRSRRRPRMRVPTCARPPRASDRLG